MNRDSKKNLGNAVLESTLFLKKISQNSKNWVKNFTAERENTIADAW